MLKTLLVTGGLGYIGSHTIVEILKSTEIQVIIIDNLSNCFDDVYDRLTQILVSEIGEEEVKERLLFKKGDILDWKFLESVFAEAKSIGKPINGIMHFAALKALN